MNTLGIILPMGQSKQLLRESGQWQLWEGELVEYKKRFDHVVFFEYLYADWRRYVEALLYPLLHKQQLQQCSALKAIHLTGAIPCMLSKWYFRIPFLLSFGYRYDQFARIDKKWPQWVFAKILSPLAIRAANAVMVPTEELKHYVKHHGAKTAEVIPNGVDIQCFKGRTLSNQGPTLRNKKRIEILFVGRLERQKNLEVLIRAVHEFSKRPSFPDLRLLFVGSGSLREELITLAKKLHVHLEMRAPVPHNQLSDIYRHADIFVLPSLVEGHPKVLLEAMACGLPCIASDIAGVRDIMTGGEDGFLAKPTVRAIRECLERLTTDSQLRSKLGKEARRTIERKYDKRELIDKEITLLQSL